MSGGYEVIYADFPWPYTSFGTAKLPYNSMSTEEISDFDWSKWASKRCLIFSWATCPMLEVAIGCGLKWREQGFSFQGVPYIWVKTKQDGTPIKASGPRPRLVKPLDEMILAYSNAGNQRTFPLLLESQVQHVFEPKPKRGEHSKKPGIFRDLIVNLVGDRPRIELFARERVAGWDAWGDELP